MAGSTSSRQAWKRPWIKLWVELLDDPKYLDLGPAQQLVWVNLLLATARSPEPGKMLRPNRKPMSPEQIRAAVRAHSMAAAEFEATLRELESMGMVHWEDGALTITHWHERQDPEPAAQRMRRYRERQRVGNGHPGVTERVTERHAQGNSPGPDAVTERHGQGNAPGTAERTDVTPPVTARLAPAQVSVTEPHAVTQGNAARAGAVTEAVTQRHTRSKEGEEGGGATPHPEEERSVSSLRSETGGSPALPPSGTLSASFQDWAEKLRSAKNGRDTIGVLGEFALAQYPDTSGRPSNSSSRGPPSLQQVCRQVGQLLKSTGVVPEHLLELMWRAAAGPQREDYLTYVRGAVRKEEQRGRLRKAGRDPSANSGRDTEEADGWAGWTVIGDDEGGEQDL